MALSLLFLILAVCVVFVRIADSIQFLVTEGTSRMLGKHADALITNLGIVFLIAGALAGLMETL